MWLSRGNGDADLAPGLGIGLLKGHVGHQTLDQLLQIFQGNTRATTGQQATEETNILAGLITKHGGVTNGDHFLISVASQHPCHHGTRTGSRYHPWQQSLLQQYVHHSQMQEPKHTTTAEHQCRAPETNIGPVEEIHLLLGRDFTVIQLRQQFQRGINFINVIFDEPLGA